MSLPTEGRRLLTRLQTTLGPPSYETDLTKWLWTHREPLVSAAEEVERLRAELTVSLARAEKAEQKLQEMMTMDDWGSYQAAEARAKLDREEDARLDRLERETEE